MCCLNDEKAIYLLIARTNNFLIIFNIYTTYNNTTQQLSKLTILCSILNGWWECVAFWVIWKLLIQKFEQYGTRVWKTWLILRRILSVMFYNNSREWGFIYFLKYFLFEKILKIYIFIFNKLFLISAY
jgi:hypothetical protein